MDQVKNSQAGFTLIETAISMLVMAIVGLGVAGLFAYAAKSTMHASDREMATAVAQQRMEQLRSASFSDASLAETASGGDSTIVTRRDREFAVNTVIVDSTATTKTITIKVMPLASSAKWETDPGSMFGSVTLVSNRSAQQVGENRSL